jgi:ADP-ribosylglycohydrolase
MLVEAAIGDAFGGLFEWGCEKEEIAPHLDKPNFLEYKEYQPGLIPPGNYTDDTQMMIGVAETVLSKNWDRLIMAETFVQCFHRDKRRGYTSAFLNLLLNSSGGKELLSKIGGSSNRSGAAMRAAPIGFIKTINDLKKASDIQASITHDSIEGQESSLIVGLMAHYLIYELGPLKDIDKWLLSNTTPQTAILEPWDGSKVDALAIPCVRAARTAIFNNKTLSGILKESVSYSGDTDTVACIALSIASNCKEIVNDLPENLYSGLENKTYGRDYLIDLDNKLKAAAAAGKL